MNENKGLIAAASIEESYIPEEMSKVETTPKKRIFTLTFGIVALLLGMSAASFAAIISTIGLNAVFTEKGLLPMGLCLVGTYIDSISGILFSILSQKLGIICGLNKVSLALSIASSVAGTMVFLTLATIFIIN